jgi:hypothetical protein
MHHGTSRDEESRVQLSVGLFWPYIKEVKMAPVLRMDPVPVSQKNETLGPVLDWFLKI